MSCKCQGCGEQYKVDLIVPDEVWERIKPEGKPPGAGLLCGACIMARIEAGGDYDAWNLTREKERRFPIQDGPSIPWRMIAPHDAQCKKNHGGQDLERIAERKGFSPSEALCVLDDEGWSESKWGDFLTEWKDRKTHPKVVSAHAELERRRAAFEEGPLERLAALERDRDALYFADPEHAIKEFISFMLKKGYRIFLISESTPQIVRMLPVSNVFREFREFKKKQPRMVTQEERSRRRCPYPRDEAMEDKWEPRKPE